jgi:hypothetical protein
MQSALGQRGQHAALDLVPRKLLRRVSRLQSNDLDAFEFANQRFVVGLDRCDRCQLYDRTTDLRSGQQTYECPARVHRARQQGTQQKRQSTQHRFQRRRLLLIDSISSDTWITRAFSS